MLKKRKKKNAIPQNKEKNYKFRLDTKYQYIILGNYFGACAQSLKLCKILKSYLANCLTPLR